MSLISLLIMVIVLGLILYLISVLPIDPKFKQIATVLAIIVAIIWLLQLFLPGVWLRSPRIN